MLVSHHKQGRLPGPEGKYKWRGLADAPEDDLQMDRVSTCSRQLALKHPREENDVTSVINLEYLWARVLVASPV